MIENLEDILENLEDILLAHAEYRRTNGESGVRADLSRAYLSGADLNGADLSGADLRHAYLSGADLRGAYLSGADLRRAYLSGANLNGADLSGADLSGANLSGADLNGANLNGADLRGARGIIRLSFSYESDLVIVRYDDVPRILCGYNWFVSPADARAHWRAHADEQCRTVVLPALERLLAQARDDGWPGCDPTPVPALSNGR